MAAFFPLAQFNKPEGKTGERQGRLVSNLVERLIGRPQGGDDHAGGPPPKMMLSRLFGPGAGGSGQFLASPRGGGAEQSGETLAFFTGKKKTGWVFFLVIHWGSGFCFGRGQKMAGGAALWPG